MSTYCEVCCDMTRCDNEEVLTFGTDEEIELAGWFTYEGLHYCPFCTSEIKAKIVRG